MAKRPTSDGSGDNEDLQALFDSIASDAAKPAPAPAASSDTSGDNEELQSLFDSVASGSPGSESSASVVLEGEAREVHAAPMSAEERQESVFQQIGQMTRLLHDTLHELGYDRMLEETARQIPDARDRLAYIATMTEQAASRVLNATDMAKPIQEKLELDASRLHSRWGKLYAKELDVEQFKALAGETHKFLGQTAEDARQVNAHLMEIMMAQDFQDLTGQVIKKVVDMAGHMERELLKVLIEVIPANKRTVVATDSLLNGPVISSDGREDVVTNQEQVDDLLESLGF